MAREPFIPPPPKREDVFGTIDTVQVRVEDGRKNRPKKEQEQFNTRTRMGVKDDVDQRRRSLSAELGRDVTRGEFLEWMIAAWDEQKSGAGFAEALGKAKGEMPSPDDEAGNRTKLMKFWATKEVERTFYERQKITGWTLGTIIEDQMAKAARLAIIERK